MTENKYTAVVTQHDCHDDIAEWRRWRGTITSAEGTWRWEQREDGLDPQGYIPNRLFLGTTNPDNKQVAWSRTKDAPAVRAAVNKAIREAGDLYRPIRKEQEDPTTFYINIKPREVVLFYDGNTATTYQRREDGSVDLNTKAERAMEPRE